MPEACPSILSTAKCVLPVLVGPSTATTWDGAWPVGRSLILPGCGAGIVDWQLSSRVRSWRRRSVERALVAGDGQAADHADEDAERGEARPGVGERLAFQQRAADDAQEVGHRDRRADRLGPAGHATE